MLYLGPASTNNPLTSAVERKIRFNLQPWRVDIPHQHPFQNHVIILAVGIEPINSTFVTLPDIPPAQRILSTICTILMFCSSPLQEMVVHAEVRHPVRPVGSDISQITLFCVPF